MKHGINSRYLSNQTGKQAHNRPPQKAAAGEVWIVKGLKFDGSDGSKDRPIVVVSVDGTAVKCYYCTSQSSAIRKRYEILDPGYAGLEKDTFVDLELRSVSSAMLSYKVGILSPDDMGELRI